MKKLTDSEIISQIKDDGFRHLHTALTTIGSVMSYSNSYETVLEALDISVIESAFIKLIEYVKVLKRFNALNKLFDDKIFVNRIDKVFEIEGHKFTTLDEVERVYNNKAFL